MTSWPSSSHDVPNGHRAAKRVPGAPSPTKRQSPSRTRTPSISASSPSSDGGPGTNITGPSTPPAKSSTTDVVGNDTGSSAVGAVDVGGAAPDPSVSLVPQPALAAIRTSPAATICNFMVLGRRRAFTSSLVPENRRPGHAYRHRAEAVQPARYPALCACSPDR